MKRISLVLVLGSLAACGTLHKGGGRGSTIQRTDTPADPTTPRALG